MVRMWMVAVVLVATVWRADSMSLVQNAISSLMPSQESNGAVEICYYLGLSLLYNPIDYNQCRAQLYSAMQVFGREEVYYLVNSYEANVIGTTEGGVARQEPNSAYYTYTIVAELASKNWSSKLAKQMFQNVRDTHKDAAAIVRINTVNDVVRYADAYWWSTKMGERYMKVLNVFSILGSIVQNPIYKYHLNRYFYWAFDKDNLCSPEFVVRWTLAIDTNNKERKKLYNLEYLTEENEHEFYDLACNPENDFQLSDLTKYTNHKTFFYMIHPTIVRMLKHHREVRHINDEYSGKIFVRIGRYAEHWKDEEVSLLLRRLDQNIDNVPGYAFAKEKNEHDYMRSEVITTIVQHFPAEWWVKVTGPEFLKVFNVYEVLTQLTEKAYVAGIDNYYKWATRTGSSCSTRTVMILLKYFFIHVQPSSENRKFQRAITFKDREEIYAIVCDPKYGWTGQEGNLEELLGVIQDPYKVPPVHQLRLAGLKGLVMYWPKMWNLDVDSLVSVFKAFSDHKWDFPEIDKFMDLWAVDSYQLKTAYMDDRERSMFLLDQVKKAVAYSPASWWKRFFQIDILNHFDIVEVLPGVTVDPELVEYLEFYRQFIEAGNTAAKLCSSQSAVQAMVFAKNIVNSKKANEKSKSTIATKVYDVACLPANKLTAADISNVITTTDFQKSTEEVLKLLKK